jgi:hypothetical protein
MGMGQLWQSGTLNQHGGRIQTQGGAGGHLTETAFDDVQIDNLLGGIDQQSRLEQIGNGVTGGRNAVTADHLIITFTHVLQTVNIKI